MAKNRPPLPIEPLTRERVLEAIRKAGGKAQKRDIAHELGIGPDQKKELRDILRELEESGALGRTGRKSYADAQALPESGVMDIVDRDPDGELLARMRGTEGYFGPTIRLAPGEARRMKGEAAIGVGDRVLAKIVRDDDGEVHRPRRQTPRPERASHSRRLSRQQRSARRVSAAAASSPPTAKPATTSSSNNSTSAKPKTATSSSSNSRRNAAARTVPSAASSKRSSARKAIRAPRRSWPCTRTASAKASRPTKKRKPSAAQKPTLKGRTDLRNVPLITIDPEDARDHDDAVYATPDTDEKNKGGWRVWVAIADVCRLRDARLSPRSRRLATWQLHLLPRSRRADAAGIAFRRSCVHCAKTKSAPALRSR